MAISVREGIDYKILPDDYRKNFVGSYRPHHIDKQGRKIYKCLYCGKEIALGEELGNEAPLEVDHIIPKTRLLAGKLWNPNHAWNLGPSCKTCNIKKSNYIDGRVIDGFQNKLLQKYGFGSTIAHNRSGSGDSNIATNMAKGLVLAVYLLKIMKYPIIILSAGIQLLIFLFTRTLGVAYKAVKWTGLKLFKHAKHPIRTIKTVVGSATTCAIIYGIVYLMGGWSNTWDALACLPENITLFISTLK